MEIVWLAFFWWQRQKIFLSIFEIAPKNLFVIFFRPKIDFRIQTNIFEEKILHAKFNFFCV